MNPFFNSEERRIRAGIRIPVFVFLSFLAVAVGQSFFQTDLDYAIAAVLSLGVLWFFLRFVDNRPSIKIAGLAINGQWVKEFFAGMALALVAMSVIFGIQWLTGTITITGYGWEFKGGVHWLWPVLVACIQMLNVGFYEEWMFRSYLLTNLKEGFTFPDFAPRKATIFAVIFSSVLFGLAHAPNENATLISIIHIAFAGVMLSIPYVLTGRLSYSVGLHFAWNFIQGGVFGFRVSGIPFRNSFIHIQQHGPAWWTGGNFGPEGGVIGLLAILLISAYFYITLKNRENPGEFHGYFSKSYTELYND